MEFRVDDRGQAVQIGAILLFAILIISMSVYQATVVPQQNEEIEFNGYQQATADMLTLRNDVMAAATRDVQTGTTVHAGVQYPSRTIFVNPGPAMGVVSAESAPNVSIRGVRAVDSESANVVEYWNETGANASYAARRVVFHPGYNIFDAPPIALTGSGAYRSLNDSVLPLTGQTLISGNRITVLTLRGNVSASGYTTAVTSDPVSAATRTVTITGTGSTFTVTVPTPGNATAWNDTVGTNLVNGNPNVVAATPHANGSATVTLDGSRRYELRLAAVELHSRSDASIVPSPGPAYLLPVTENETAASGRPKTVAVEVRDRYNNPVSGEVVNFSITDGSGTLSSPNVTTDGEGRARVTLTPDAGFTGTLTVEASQDLNGNGTVETYENTTFEFVVTDADAGAGNVTGEQGGRSRVVLVDYQTPATNQNTFDLSIENIESTSANVTGYRLDYATRVQSNGEFEDGPTAIESVTFDVGGTSTTVTGTASEGRSPHFIASPVEIAPGQQDIQLRFDAPILAQGGGPGQGQGGTSAAMLAFSLYLETGDTATFTVHIVV